MTEVQARLSPGGFVAQRLGDHDLQRHGPWVLVWLSEDRLNMQVLNDDEVADWPRLEVVPGEHT